MARQKITDALLRERGGWGGLGVKLLLALLLKRNEDDEPILNRRRVLEHGTNQPEADE